jgi:hypothetical protein
MCGAVTFDVQGDLPGARTQCGRYGNDTKLLRGAVMIRGAVSA